MLQTLLNKTKPEALVESRNTQARMILSEEYAGSTMELGDLREKECFQN
jgi:hypothetical protein